MMPKRFVIALMAGLILSPMSPVMVKAEPGFWVNEWPNTDFVNNSIESWVEIISGGPPRDGIPALNDPGFHPIAEEMALDDREPVMTVEFEGEVARAYPVRFLLWHEIVNDTVGGIPIAVTFCPLCNSGITFDRRTDAGVLTFGVTGKLRNSDMIMFDRETESWWQQATGEAIVGELTEMELVSLPSWMESWSEFKARNPDGLVMDQPKFSRDYGLNPYTNYDSRQTPFFNAGTPTPEGIPQLSRVVRVGDRAWPLTRLAALGEIREAGVVLSWSAGQASALDTARISEARDIGNVRVRDEAGNNLPHDVLFAFAYQAFWPEGEWMTGEQDDPKHHE